MRFGGVIGEDKRFNPLSLIGHWDSPTPAFSATYGKRVSGMLNPVHVSKVKRNGHSIYVVLPAPLVKHITWREGDSVAIRQAGVKLIIERVALEELAKIRTGELEVHS